MHSRTTQYSSMFRFMTELLAEHTALAPLILPRAAALHPASSWWCLFLNVVA